jgi:uncharacterized membrane protein YdjX (TVP38/TMEM64 family)
LFAWFQPLRLTCDILVSSLLLSNSTLVPLQCGACAVSTWDFLLGTAVGLTPGTVMMSWVGWSLR